MAGPAFYGAVVSIAKNDDWLVPFIYQTVDPDTLVATPIDLTGSILKMEIRKREVDRQVYVSVSNDPPTDGITINDAAAGTFTILIERARLQNIPPGDYVTDLVREMPNGIQERLFEGTANVVEGTTR